MAVCLAGAMASLDAAGAARSSADPADRPVRTVTLRVGPASPLPAAVVATMQKEVDAIWRHEGVVVRWLDSRTREALPADVLRVAILADDRIPLNVRHEWPVAELVTDDDGRPWAVTSIAAASRVMRAAIGTVEPRNLQERRLGLVLGRGLAHEIGHYVLRTPHHARTGLMRTRIQPGQLVDLQRTELFLDATASRWLQQTAMAGASAELAPAFDAYQ